MQMKSNISMMRSSDIRELLMDPNISDFPESENDDYEAGLLGESDHGSCESLASNNDETELNLVNSNDLTDFSSGSGDDYIPDSSDLESSDRDVAVPGPSDSNTSKARPSYSK
ncbi:hypothetical protein J6590_002012 [Homalodisca vitripennis]|nr:hypothetical protein J6590_002012 [Homalodisca vitripennis]